MAGGGSDTAAHLALVVKHADERRAAVLDQARGAGELPVGGGRVEGRRPRIVQVVVRVALANEPVESAHLG